MANRGPHALVGVRYPEARPVPATAVEARASFNAAAVGQFQRAAQAQSRAVTATDDSRLAGWLLEQQAVYTHFFDRAQAQRILAGALERNRSVPRPRDGVAYRRLKPAASQAAGSAAYLASTHADGVSLQIGVGAVLDDLSFGEETDRFEDAFAHLGAHLGLPLQRPEQENRAWARRPTLARPAGVCKSGASADRIWKRDVNQLAGSMNWFRESYDHSCTGTPLLVHPVAAVERDASPPAGMRVLTSDKLEQLKAAVNVSLALSPPETETTGTSPP
jgi:hypothetical protein